MLQSRTAADLRPEGEQAMARGVVAGVVAVGDAEVAAAMAIRRGIALGRKGGAIAIGNEGMIRKWRGQEGQVE